MQFVGDSWLFKAGSHLEPYRNRRGAGPVVARRELDPLAAMGSCPVTEKYGANWRSHSSIIRTSSGEG